MLVLTIIDTVLLVAAVIYIVALLRSHADILRRLSMLENAAPAAPGRTGGGPGRVAGAADLPDLDAAPPVSGTTLGGDSVALSFGAGSPVTLLAFLSGGCTSCRPLWEGLSQAPDLGELADRVVVITHGTDRESPARVARLAPPQADLVMSSAAWEDYAVPASPHFVLTDGAGGILGRGSALSWSQLMTMVSDARADALDDQARARTTAERALRSEQALARAGIGPGHPSLYPSTDPDA